MVIKALTYHEYTAVVHPVVNRLFHSAVSVSAALNVTEENDGKKEKKEVMQEDSGPGLGTVAGGDGEGSRIGPGGNGSDDRRGVAVGDATVPGRGGTLAGVWAASGVDGAPGSAEKLGIHMDLDMDEDSVGGDDGNRRKEKEKEKERDGDNIPEFGIFDIIVEIDEGPRDVYRNMMALLPPPKVQHLHECS